MKKILGTNTLTYNERRNFADLPFTNFTFRKKQNLNKLPAYVYFKIKGKTHYAYWNTFRDFDLNKVGLFHFFNALSVGNTPWITTFETSLPRWGANASVEKGLRLIERNACKKIIAMSACAADIQRKIVADKFPQFSAILEEKLTILHPPQKKLIQNIQEKSHSDIVRFTLIGTDFFRKGGKEIVEVFENLYKKGIRNWKLNIVSKMDYGDYASQTTVHDLKNAQAIIAQYPDHIEHFYQLPNQEVLSLLKDSDVGLLPTYGDTFGYSVLEAQASGCPVISTNIRALPEINDKVHGWMIEVPKDEFGNGILATESERLAFSKTLSSQMYAIIKEILDSPENVQKKAVLALDRIEQQHSIQTNTRILETLYSKFT